MANKPKYSYITEYVRQTLHWLPVSKNISFKIIMPELLPLHHGNQCSNLESTGSAIVVVDVLNYLFELLCIMLNG